MVTIGLKNTAILVFMGVKLVSMIINCALLAPLAFISELIHVKLARLDANYVTRHPVLLANKDTLCQVGHVIYVLLDVRAVRPLAFAPPATAITLSTGRTAA